MRKLNWDYNYFLHSLSTSAICVLVHWIVYMYRSMYCMYLADVVSTDLMDRRLTELRDRLHYAESLNQDRESDIQTLRQQLNVLMLAHKNNNM